MAAIPWKAHLSTLAETIRAFLGRNLFSKWFRILEEYN
jgi:hypothetical protein